MAALLFTWNRCFARKLLSRRSCNGGVSFLKSSCRIVAESFWTLASQPPPFFPADPWGMSFKDDITVIIHLKISALHAVRNADIIVDRTFSQIYLNGQYFKQDFTIIKRTVIINVLLTFKIVNYTKFTFVRKFFVLQPWFWMQMPGCKKQHIYMSKVIR